ncbi:MAG TPA: hypothetical protein VFV72_03010 [Candidatus Limnocylindrales bacterium]|nr:hypothetical protein [Candidatus Limnocylindrales bacterium]
MAIDEQHVALPKLYGAPAYARPPRHVLEEADRPFDPDDLPIEVHQTEEERYLMETLPARSYAPGGAPAHGQRAAHPTTPIDKEPQLHPKPLSLKALAGRVLGKEKP